jgi:hypothetical protein
VPVPADRDLDPEQLTQLARERLEDRQAGQPASGAEQRSEAPADAERPEAGACPPTRKPPRKPPTGGEGATDKAERGGRGGGGGSRLPSTKCGDGWRGVETPENRGGLRTARQLLSGIGLIYGIRQDTGGPHGRVDVSERRVEAGACRLVIRGGRDGC